MRIFQGKQAEQIEAKTEQLEVALKLAHGKGPIEDRLAEIVRATIVAVRAAEVSERELRTWRAPIMDVARGLAKVFELANDEAKAEAERRSERRGGRSL